MPQRLPAPGVTLQPRGSRCKFSVSSACHDGIPHTGGSNTRQLFLALLEAGSPSSRYQQIWFPLGAHSWLAHSYLPTVSPHGGESKCAGVSFSPSKSSNTILRVSPSWPQLNPITSQRPTPNATTLEVRAEPVALGRTQTFQLQHTLGFWTFSVAGVHGAHRPSIPGCSCQGAKGTGGLPCGFQGGIGRAERQSGVGKGGWL